MEENEIVEEETLYQMGMGKDVVNGVLQLLGRMPTMGELSTLVAMWDSNGRQQSFLGWLKGQYQPVERHDYLYDGTDEAHHTIREPKVKDCLDIVKDYCDHCSFENEIPVDERIKNHGHLLYLVGNLSTDFLQSEYARQYLHIASDPIVFADHEDESAYLELIVQSLFDRGYLESLSKIGEGGLLGALCRCGHPSHLGFDILCCRETRLDAFLFGEEYGRFLVSLKEENDDFFLRKIEEARLNCCYLGRATRGRMMIDGMDFGVIP